MLAIFMAPIYIVMNAFILLWLYRWIKVAFPWKVGKKIWICSIAFYVLAATSLLTGFLISQGGVHRWLKILSNYWLGAFIYIFSITAIGVLIRLILKFTPLWKKQWLHTKNFFVTAGILSIALMVGVSLYGFHHAQDTKLTQYDITIEKKCNLDGLKVVLVADLHLGYSVGNVQMERMVNMVNEQNPDLVVVAGDIFDNEYDAIDNPDLIAQTLRGIKSTYGVYSCWGNHDLNEKILAGFTFSSNEAIVPDQRFEEFLEKSNIQMLEDESVLIADSFYLVGRKDPSRVKKTEENRLSPEEILGDLDQTKPIFVVEHQPKALEEMAEAGADAHLCGHTHDGQIFPGNLTIHLMWENPTGMIKKGDMYSIVTSGVGLWGPNMRVGTDSEVVAIDVEFSK